MRRLIGKVSIVAGIVIILAVIYENYTVSQDNNKLVSEYKQSIENKAQISDVVGILEIPKISLEVVVKEGTDKGTLKNAVGHFEDTVLPGEYGNFAVAGHRAYTSNKFFSDLDELEIGDELKVLLNNKTHLYKVNNIEVVEPEQVEVIDSKNKDKKEITLVTCTPKYIGSHRLIVKGESTQ